MVHGIIFTKHIYHNETELLYILNLFNTGSVKIKYLFCQMKKVLVFGKSAFHLVKLSLRCLA